MFIHFRQWQKKTFGDFLSALKTFKGIYEPTYQEFLQNCTYVSFQMKNVFLSSRTYTVVTFKEI